MLAGGQNLAKVQATNKSDNYKKTSRGPRGLAGAGFSGCQDNLLSEVSYH